jgi:opacity protein-like surface antigen
MKAPAARSRSSGGGHSVSTAAVRNRSGLALRAAVLAVLAQAFAWAPRAHAQGYGRGSREYYSQAYQRLRWDIGIGGNLTQGTTSQYLDNGWTLEGGVTWFPAEQSVLGLRLDVSYSRFGATNQFVYRSAQEANTQIDDGVGRIWGGDADLVLDMPLGARTHGYLLAGIGTYQRQIELRQTVRASGYFCDPWWGVCGLGFAPFDSVVSRTTTATHFAWNAGAAVEFSLDPTTSLFIEARFLRINPAQERTELVPITVGLRF